MEMESNWKYNTLQNLENSEWLSSDYDSRLIRRIKELRKIPLYEYSIEDLRIMISENVGLEYLIPLALEKLHEDILAEGNLYKGDLLLAVVNSRDAFWKNHPSYQNELIELVEKNKEILDKEGIEISFDD